MVTLNVWWGWIERLILAIGCPFNWDRQTHDPELRRIMRLYWEETAERFQADNEMYLYRQANATSLLNEESLKVIETNAAIWRQRAAIEYFERIVCFWQFTYLTPVRHSKHFALPGTPDAQIVTKTINGDACYFHHVTHDDLQRYAAHALKAWWRRIIENHPPHLYLQSTQIIGASKGKPTNRIRFDLDYSTFEIHGHPILENEKPGDQQWLHEHGDEYEENAAFNTYHLIDEEWQAGIPEDVATA